MNLGALTPRQSKMLAGSILAALVLLILTIVVGPISWLYYHYDQAIDKQADLLARYSRLGATTADLARQLEALKAKNPREFFLKSTVPAMAASEVQEMVKTAVEGNGGKVISLQIPAHKDDGNFRKVTVNIQMSATVTATQKIFYALETQKPYFLLDNVSIHSNALRIPRDANPLGPEIEHIVQFDVFGYAVLAGRS